MITFKYKSHKSLNNSHKIVIVKIIIKTAARQYVNQYISMSQSLVKNLFKRKIYFKDTSIKKKSKRF
jgi:hypothetical protein